MSVSTRRDGGAGRLRRGPVLGLATAAVLTMSGALVPGSAQAAAPAAGPVRDCATAYPQARLSAGQSVHGLTVTTGTTPGGFTGSVLGVLTNGIGPGIDMILMNLSSPDIDADGIWEGMSGSPVYDDATGDLIGAVSYTQAYGKTTIAGVTPFAAMQRYLPKATKTAPAKVDIDSLALTQRVAKAAGITTAQAEEGMERLPTPVSVAGLSSQRVKAMNRSDKPYLKHTLAAGRMGAADAGGKGAPGPESLMAGGNLVAAISYGDVTMAGIGTVTSVCGGSLVGFGHPMNSTGTASMALMTGDALGIQPDPLGSAFKLANVGAVAGTINQDRTPAIAGPLGHGPAVTKYTATASYGSRSRTGTSYGTMADYAADTAFGQTVGNSDAVLDAYYVKGGALGAYTVKGTDHGHPFSLSFTNRYADTADVSSAAGYDLGDLTYALSAMPGVTLTSTRATETFNNVSTTRHLGVVQQRKAHHWVTVSNKTPITIRPGRTVRLRVALAGAGLATKYQRVAIAVAKRFKGASGWVTLQGGNDDYADFYDAGSLTQVKKVLAGSIRNDRVAVEARLRRHGHKLDKSLELTPIERVVKGYKQLPFEVKKK